MTLTTTSYYWDHQQELDQDMERRYQWAEKMRQEAEETPGLKKLRAKGLI